MLRYYYINKEWIVSGTARRTYRIAAGLSLALFFMLVAVRLVGAIPEALPVVKLLLFAGVLGAATTMIAMEYFLFGFDTSSAMKKVFWFCVMLFPLLGPALYCFIVYSRSDVLKGNRAKSG
jgi:predicted tellurium resistance membrane protein TerC